MENTEVLKIKILLCFLNSDTADCTVTGIARTLNKEKYAVSRALAALEKDNYVDRSDVRKPVLTQAGHAAASEYAERVRVSLDHLLYEGVDVEFAKQDALYWACYCSSQTMDAVRSADRRYRVKYELRGKQRFGGAVLCRQFLNGTYHVPFVVYREHVANGSNISVANEAFEHPCVLRVENGVGTIHLRAVSMSRYSPADGKPVTAKIQGVKYFSNGRFISAENYGDLFSVPADTLDFINVGSGVEQLIHGSVCLQVECPMDMGGKNQVILTLFI